MTARRTARATGTSSRATTPPATIDPNDVSEARPTTPDAARNTAPTRATTTSWTRERRTAASISSSRQPQHREHQPGQEQGQQHQREDVPGEQRPAPGLLGELVEQQADHDGRGHHPQQQPQGDPVLAGSAPGRSRARARPGPAGAVTSSAGRPMVSRACSRLTGTSWGQATTSSQTTMPASGTASTAGHAQGLVAQRATDEREGQRRRQGGCGSRPPRRPRPRAWGQTPRPPARSIAPVPRGYAVTPAVSAEAVHEHGQGGRVPGPAPVDERGRHQQPDHTQHASPGSGTPPKPRDSGGGSPRPRGSGPAPVRVAGRRR